MFLKTKEIFDNIFENRLEEDEVREYLIDLYEKGETSSQIAAAAASMREHLIPVELNKSLQEEAIDIVGTGGDKSNSFNISSTSAILLASCDCKVAKHGSRSATSNSGSADMLEALGIKLDVEISKLDKMLEETNFCFMFAQNHHPAMKHIMPIRKTIPHRTIFNILGPLCNPAFVKKCYIGVFSKNYINKMVEALELLELNRAMVVSSKDSMDEVSISDITYATILDNGKTNEIIIDPQNYGLKLAPKSSILGGDAIENAKITKDILEGKIVGAKRDIVLINTAVALFVDSKARDIKEGIEIAKDAIESGASKKRLEKIIKVSNSI